MSPCIFSCVLCGYAIYDYEDPNSASWLKQFRALYYSQTGIWVSGVGLYNDIRAGQWIVPLDYDARWDDVGYDFPAGDWIGVMQQGPVNGRHGFVFHESCWSLLEKAYYPEDVPCARLLEVCKSLPFPQQGTGVSWGHNFGGLVRLDSKDHYPWEDRPIEWDMDSKPFLSARENPYDVPEIQQLLKEAPQSPPRRKQLSSSGPITARKDCFTMLYQELYEEIAAYLPTSDVLSLRLASRDFTPVFSSQKFWASRFKANADRCWIFETRNAKEPRDWRWLYRRTNDAHSTPGLKNRKRVWMLIPPLKDVLSLCWNESSAVPLRQPNLAGLRWTEVAGDVKQETPAGTYYHFNEGCRLFHKQRTSIPDLLSQIAISIVRLGDAEYIAGLRLISSNGIDIQLGYKAEGKELFLEVTVLRGFNLAVGSRGIQAVQVITGKRCVSRWFGCPNESPITQRLAVSQHITALEAGFDGYKMVSLAVAAIPSSGGKMSMGVRNSLRDTALWYPKIPDPGLYMNDNSTTGEDSYIIEYQPLFWASFGGPSGIYLRYLTGISATWLGTLRSIEFHYNTEEVPIECRKLGRCRSTEYAQIMRFPIDGPGGETIQVIEVNLKYLYGENVYSFYKRGALISFKISTSHGRSCSFGPTQAATDDVKVKPVAIAPGTTVTGFYASQHPEMSSLISLGVMSEIIEENSENNVGRAK